VVPCHAAFGLPETKELARHTDIKMTIRYTHVGIADQAEAIRKLPWNGAMFTKKRRNPCW